MVVTEDDIMPLVNITKDDENVIWDGDKVLVLFMHKYPDSYPAGEEIKLKWGDVWCVSAVEAVALAVGLVTKYLIVTTPILPPLTLT